MKKMVPIIAACVLLCAFCGCANYIIGDFYDNAEAYSVGDFTYNVKDVERIEIYWARGSVNIKNSDKETLSAIEKNNDSGDEGFKMRWLIDGKTLFVRFCESGFVYKDFFLKKGDKNLDIEIPDGIELVVSTVSASVCTENHELKDAEISSVSGDLTLVSMKAAEISLSTTSGKIKWTKELIGDEIGLGSVSGEIIGGELSAGTIEIGTTSGKVSLQSVVSRKDFFCDTVSGSVSVGDFVGAEDCVARISTTSGYVNLGLESAGRISVGTVSGDVKITLLGENGFTADYSTVSGSFVCDKYSVENRKFVVGNGKIRLEVETTSGDFFVKQ